jgi:hypothetical protein
MSAEETEAFERSATKLQAMQRGRAARAEVKTLREGGAGADAIRSAEEAEEAVMRIFTGSPEEQAAGLTLVPVSAQPEQCLTHKSTLHTLNTP